MSASRAGRARFSRYHKYTLGTELRDGARRVLKLIVRANARRDKVPLLLDVREEVEALKVLVRLSQDVKAFANFGAFATSPMLKTVFRRNPAYFDAGRPLVDEVHWLVLEDPSAALAAYLAGQLDCGPWHWWAVRQHDLELVKRRRPGR